MKKIAFLLIFVLCCFTFSGCGSLYNYTKDLTSYDMDILYDETKHALTIQQTTDYVNTSNNILSYIKFHLYPNAFREGAKAKVVSVQNSDLAYPNGESYGDIKIQSVETSGESADFEVGGEDENILTVNLKNELYPNDRAIIYIEYEVTLANINHRLGYGENAVNLCNFYPVVCMYESDDFVCDLYNSNGDPFYSAVSDYDVTITYPNSYILASTGNQKTQNFELVKKTNILAQCVRDFGMVLSKEFQQKSGVIDDDLTVNYYYYNDENCDQTLEFVKKVMTFFEEKIGKYPYSQISVVKTNFVHGGMEYPNMVLISDNIIDDETYELVIVHELLHQWWYCVVGNNQFDYGWIDEGLTEFCTVYFYEKHPDYNRTMSEMISSATKSYKTFAKVYESVQGSVDTSMNRPLDEFATEPEYVYNTYVKGTLMFSTIYDLVGEKRFVNALKYYYENNLYKIATPSTVIQCFSRGTGKNLEDIFTSFLDGKVVIK